MKIILTLLLFIPAFLLDFMTYLFGGFWVDYEDRPIHALRDLNDFLDNL